MCNTYWSLLIFFCIRDVGIFVLLKFVNKLEIIIRNIKFDSICPHLMQQSGQELYPKTQSYFSCQLFMSGIHAIVLVILTIHGRELSFKKLIMEFKDSFFFSISINCAVGHVLNNQKLYHKYPENVLSVSRK